ncbi:MAG: NAD-dependent epimerase/dehydratase family protein [Chloroflexota bacterium]
MSVFVTGATGFIGSHLCRELVAGGHRVVALGHSGRTGNIAPLLHERNFKLHTGDVQDTALMAHLIKDNQVRTVFHLAARLPREDDADNPLPGFDVNARGTLSVLQAAASNAVVSFIYASTMSVYSTPPHRLPVDEEHPAQPATTYGAAKLSGELACRAYDDRMKVMILRYGGVYGLHCRESDAVPTFIRQARNNQPITIHGDGTQSSDFVYVGDAVRGTLLAWEKGKLGVYNIGGGRETSVRELAEKIVAITGSKSEITVAQTGAERPFRFVLDISRAHKVLGYAPLPLEEGLRRYLAGLTG